MAQEYRSVMRNSEFLHELWADVFPGREIPTRETTFLLVGQDGEHRPRKESKRNGMIVLEGMLRPNGVSFPGYFNITVDGKSDIVFYGNVQEVTTGGKTVPRVDAIKVKDGSLTFNPSRNEDLYIYLMLCPWNQDSPIHKTPEQQKADKQKVVLGYPLGRVRPMIYNYNPQAKMQKEESANRAIFEIEEWVRRKAKLDELIAFGREFNVIIPPDTPDMYNVLKYSVIAQAKLHPAKGLKVIESIAGNSMEMARIALDSGIVYVEDNFLKCNDSIITRMPKQMEGHELVKFLDYQLATIEGLQKEVGDAVQAVNKDKTEVFVPDPAFVIPGKGKGRGK